MTWVDFRGGLDDAEAFRRLMAGISGVSAWPYRIFRTRSIRCGHSTDRAATYRIGHDHSQQYC